MQRWLAQIKLALNLQRSVNLCFLTAEIKEEAQHSQLCRRQEMILEQRQCTHVQTSPGKETKLTQQRQNTKCPAGNQTSVLRQKKKKASPSTPERHHSHQNGKTKAAALGAGEDGRILPQGWWQHRSKLNVFFRHDSAVFLPHTYHSP